MLLVADYQTTATIVIMGDLLLIQQVLGLQPHRADPKQKDMYKKEALSHSRMYQSDHIF